MSFNDDDIGSSNINKINNIEKQSIVSLTVPDLVVLPLINL